MYIDISIYNNTDHEEPIGSYWNRFAPEDHKYGRFYIIKKIRSDYIPIIHHYANCCRISPFRCIYIMKETICLSQIKS